MYVADTSNNRIRKITVSTGVITSLAGIYLTGFYGNGGQATAATLYSPSGISLDSSGTFASNRLILHLFINNL